MFPFLAPSRWQLHDQLSLACEQRHTGRTYPGRLCDFGRPFHIIIRRYWVSKSIRPNPKINPKHAKTSGHTPSPLCKGKPIGKNDTRNHKSNQTDAMTPRSHITLCGQHAYTVRIITVPCYSCTAQSHRSRAKDNEERGRRNKRRNTRKGKTKRKKRKRKMEKMEEKESGN
ncbi:hypothetical protein CI102_11687 [Trichoderma harzianum]|nr:hypothetical protein CI102_11687 [Trichoderma harzianum]